VRISREFLDRIVAQAREEAPNECCGMIAARAGEVVEVFPARNEAASPLRYNVDPRDLHRITSAIEDEGWELGAIYHSHTRSEPYPSQTDVNTAFFPDSDDPLWPGTLYVIVGVAGPEADVRAYRIAARDKVEEVGLEVVG
jgi:[CysO sulfur-carrier protein]-S-L-cysteine hydrolase